MRKFHNRYYQYLEKNKNAKNRSDMHLFSIILVNKRIFKHHHILLYCALLKNIYYITQWINKLTRFDY